jgi:hypothetical protein
LIALSGEVEKLCSMTRADCSSRCDRASSCGRRGSRPGRSRSGDGGVVYWHLRRSKTVFRLPANDFRMTGARFRHRRPILPAISQTGSLGSKILQDLGIGILGPLLAGSTDYAVGGAVTGPTMPGATAIVSKSRRRSTYSRFSDWPTRLLPGSIRHGSDRATLRRDPRIQPEAKVEFAPG